MKLGFPKNSIPSESVGLESFRFLGSGSPSEFRVSEVPSESWGFKRKSLPKVRVSEVSFESYGFGIAAEIRV